MASSFPPMDGAWLFATLEVSVDWSAGGPLGMRIDKAHNMIVELAPDGLAQRSGLLEGDTIVDADGTLITDFTFEDGPAPNTMLCNARTAVQDASYALDRTTPKHLFRILRPLGPPPGPSQPPQPPQQQPLHQAPQPLQPQQINPLTHYPWATTFKTADGAMKNRYNMPQGAALPPMAQVQANLATTQRKAAFAASLSSAGANASTPSRRYIN